MEKQIYEKSLKVFVDGKYHNQKESLRSRISESSLFKLKFDLPLSEFRAVTNDRAKYLFSTPEIKQQIDDEAKNERNFINKSMAMGEVVSSTDLSVGVKMGVMGWLFAGAVKNLGSASHLQNFFQKMKGAEITGMFCMTERSHGSNVRAIETEATFDTVTQEFVINTPTPNTRKMYIGNALYGQYAAVFAQLYIGDICKGPHCFVVRMRDEHGNLLPGIHVEDQGFKEGLNGVDNGIISFSKVRIPRENLLNRYADVTPEGTYKTAIENDGARFNVTISALIGCRVSLSFQAIAASKVGLEIAVKYSLRRRQFGTKGKPEQLLLDYQTHQLRLMPRLATCLALTFATRYLASMLNEDIYEGKSITDDRKLQALAGGLKAYTTWEAVDTLQTCRECTGGMGYMEVNRLASLKRDADVFVTFEGDNMVMLQQVVKDLLLEYSSQYGGSKALATAAAMKDGMVSWLRTSIFAITTEPVTSVRFILKALAFKELELTRSLAARLLNKIGSLQEEPFLAWNDCLDHVTNLALTHVQRVTLEQFNMAVSKCENQEVKNTMQKFCKLFAIHLLYKDKGWHLENKFLTPTLAKQLRDKYIELCRETRQDAVDVVNAFCHPSVCVHAPIAGVPCDHSEWAYFPDSDMELKPQSKL